MINIQNKKNCCGCGACASVCPKHCIVMSEDSEGFLYPKVDKKLCVDCGLCENACNELHPFDKREPKQVLAAINKNEEVRLNSSSGGIFYILAEKTIREEGVVFGARFDKDWQVVIDYAEDMKGVKAFMGSKYVQARVDSAFNDVKRFLKDGRKVLFSGTPCQVAGLHKFLHKQYDNLLTVDFICHGTPSPKVWRLYLDEVIKEGQSISSIEFRNKKKGWKNFSFRLQYNEEEKTVAMVSPFQHNYYMKAFIHNIILRPSCYDCKAKGCSSQSDITIGDFWGISSVFPKMDDDKGTGLVFINTDKGKNELDFSKIEIAETTYERVKPLNSACYSSPSIHIKREDFFNRLDKENIIALIADCTKPTFRQQIKIMCSRCKSVVRLIGGGKTMQVVLPKSDVQILTILQNPQIVSVHFRCKDMGWSKYQMKLILRDKKK